MSLPLRLDVRRGRFVKRLVIGVGFVAPLQPRFPCVISFLPSFLASFLASFLPSFLTCFFLQFLL